MYIYMFLFSHVRRQKIFESLQMYHAIALYKLMHSSHFRKLQFLMKSAVSYEVSYFIKGSLTA